MTNLLEYLDELYENPRCELEYNKDYELLIAVMLSAQTTDKRVNKVTKVLFKKYKTLEELMNADLKALENIIKEIGTFRRKAIYIKDIARRLVLETNGIVPNDRKFIESLNGVGHKSANVVLSNIYNVPCIAVDTHVDRVSKRLGLASKNDDVKIVEKKLMKKFPKEKWSKLHHQLVLFGRYHCKAKNPNCEICKLREICKYKKSPR